jgi:pimeloyl-ACP methyl ester carboxylesterase
MSTYVLVHGAGHSGEELAPVAALIRVASHEAFTPSIKGNGPGDSKSVGLDEAIQSIVDYLAAKHLEDVVLVGHSYGGYSNGMEMIPRSERRAAQVRHGNARGAAGRLSVPKPPTIGRSAEQGGQR